MRKVIVATVLLLLVSLSANGQTADALWDDLMAGNRLYVEGQVVYGSLASARKMWATSQNPPVAILSCADSRVPAEVLFQRTVGELFVVRVAGNVQDTFGIASLEYAVHVLGTKMIVVMGHTDCGAVKASLGNERPTDALWALIQRLRQAYPPPPNLPTDVRVATVMNINYTAAQLAKNTIIGGVPIVKAMYDVATGRVERLP